MNPLVASLICAGGIAGLLYLDRERTGRLSQALWLPGLWIGIVGSRPASMWLGLPSPDNAQVDGSPVDAAILGVLLAAAVLVLARRMNRVWALLSSNWLILIYFAYCLISVAWSPYPSISFKRWIKAIGDLAMVLVIVTDAQPLAAIRRLASRIGFLLFPISLLFIRYYGELGRGYTSDGLQMNTGVTTDKNMLGLIVLVISLVAFWNVRWLLINKHESNRGRRLVAQSILLAFGVALLLMAHSSTCKACFLLGSFLIIALNLRAIRRRPARVHALCAAILLLSGVALFFGQADVADALGRQANFSGRTDIWAASLLAAGNPLIGTGFEIFWISPNVLIVERTLLSLGYYPALARGLNEAHNGYIETYLNLGWIGVCLIAFILVGGYRRAVNFFRRDPEVGSLFLAYIATAVFYSFTEVGFRMLNPCWIFLLLAVISTSGPMAGFFDGKKRKTPGPLSRAAIVDEPLTEGEVLHAGRERVTRSVSMFRMEKV